MAIRIKEPIKVGRSLNINSSTDIRGLLRAGHEDVMGGTLDKPASIMGFIKLVQVPHRRTVLPADGSG